VAAAVSVAAEGLEEAQKTALDAAGTTFSATAVGAVPLAWAKKATPALAALRKAIAVSKAELPENQEDLITELEQLARTIESDDEVQGKARTWAVSKLPKFIYLA